MRPTHYHKSLPLLGIEKLKDSGVTGTIYGYYAWGGLLIVGRVSGLEGGVRRAIYRYTPDEWERYVSVVRGEVGLAELDALPALCISASPERGRSTHCSIT